MELLRNCSHGSEISTYLWEDSGGEKKIIKTASTQDGLKCLKNEVEGWNWYQINRYKGENGDICKIIRQNEHYVRIEIDYIEGMRANYNEGLRKNADFVSRAIEHYCSVWPRDKKLAPLHGDLSIDNIIINGEGVHFIDWEHFCDCSAPWGFDAFYLIFETLWFGMIGRELPTAEEVNIIVNNINILNMPEFTLKRLKEFIINNIELWGAQVQIYPDKLPVLKFTDDQVDLIDSMIKAGLER